MKKTAINISLYALMLFMAVLLIIVVCRRSNQSVLSKPMSVCYTGEYSLNGGEWQPLCEKTELSAYDGAVTLRGRFSDMELPEGAEMRFYLNHIGIEIYRNGEILFESSQEKYPGMCGSAWVSWELPSIALDDVFEIRLYNPHSFGNRNAYNRFLDSIYVGSDVIIKNYLEHQNLPYRVVGIFILVASVALIGTAVGYSLLRLPGNGLLLKSGIMSLMMGAYIYLDTEDISFQGGQMAFNTYARRLAMMLAAWQLGACVAELLDEKRKKISEIAVYLLMLADFILMTVSLAGIREIYDTGIWWVAVQGIVSVLLLVMLITGKRTDRKHRGAMQYSAIILLLVLLLEILNVYVGWWENGICIKIIFTIIFMFQLVRAAWQVAKNQQASIREKKLGMELKNSRIVLAMSQIRTHFVFNILNAISGMCEYDSKKADETLIVFSRYLRDNINIMEQDEPETFTKALEHLEKYIFLEQVRFGEKIRFVKNIEADNFKLPPLVLQPLAENAIIHGLLHKKQGGTVSLHTWMEGTNSIIEISDDGVGFDARNVSSDKSVGMKNVRFRLEYMVGGIMDVKSTPGKGTIVTIIIPGETKNIGDGDNR